MGEFEENPILKTEEKIRAVEVEAVIKASGEADGQSLLSALGKYAEAVAALAKGDIRVLFELSKSLGRPVEAVVDTINEIAACSIGDILIEENDGQYFIIEDYLELIN